MATLFTSIYGKAVNSFDDPFIKNIYGDTITFFKVMWGYMQNAIPEFCIPESVVSKMQNIITPTGQTELFDGDGVNNIFTLSTTPLADSYFKCLVEDVEVSGTFNYNSNEIELASTPLVGNDNVSIEWYYAGSFVDTLEQREERIMTMLWVLNWAEKEKNYLLDIRRLLNDTDFKLSAEAPNMNAKNNWYSSMREEVLNMMKQYNWSLYRTQLRQKYGIT